MMKSTLSIAPEDQDLHIASHIEPEALPAIIRPVMALAQSESEKDMLLLSLLTAAGSCMPHLYCRYGLTGKRYYPNLQCFIVGSAACGKGIANLALEFIGKVHQAMPLVIPGDSSYPGFFRQLASQGGRGYIHESEGSVITDVWRSAVTNYNTALRKAAEHEPITRTRANETSSIDCPQLSVLITGTFSQYRALVPSTENGYFSRMLALVVSDHQAFSSRYVEPMEGRNGILETAADQLYELCQALYRSRSIEFTLTPEQRARLGRHMESAYPMLMSLMGENFHSVVLRMAVHIERLAMILSALRAYPRHCSTNVHWTFDQAELFTREGKGDDLLQSAFSGKMVCTDEDYNTAELIGNKLLLHMAMAYQMIKGKEQATIPNVKPLDQKQMLLSLLPDEFETKILIDEAKAQGVSERTAARWNDRWLAEGMVLKIRQGHFRKQVLSA